MPGAVTGVSAKAIAPPARAVAASGGLRMRGASSARKRAGIAASTPTASTSIAPVSAHPAAVPASQSASTQTPVSQKARQARSRRGSASAAAADWSMISCEAARRRPRRRGSSAASATPNATLRADRSRPAATEAPALPPSTATPRAASWAEPP